MHTNQIKSCNGMVWYDFWWMIQWKFRIWSKQYPEDNNYQIKQQFKKKKCTKLQ